jgi:glycosyltransferase involved in cell wall biosynthesis
MRRPGRLVMLGHYLDKPWKRALLRAASYVKHGGTVVVHSTAQRDVAAAVLHRSWTVELLPYQVDTAFWDPAKAVPSTPGGPQLVVAVGAEHRDYDTLLEAVAGLDCETVIAGGSHWARQSSAVSRAVPGVTFLAEPLPFTALRDLYARAALVVVPLHAVTNQSGVTTILEAMSMGLAVVVTATPGQREVVQGPLVTAASEDAAATADRGPAEFGFSRPAGEVTGLYVPPADAPALRAAVAALLRDSDRRGRIGAAGRRAAASCFGIEAFVERLGAVLSVPSEAQSSPSPQPATARTR